MSCVKKDSWKNYVCSIDCYREAITLGIMLTPNVINIIGSGKMRGELSSGKTVTISGYDILLGRFDCSDGQTRMAMDFNCIYVSSDEMQSIIYDFNALSQKVSSLKEGLTASSFESKADKKKISVSTESENNV